MHSWDPLSPWFSVSDKFSPIAGGVPTPAMIFPSLWEDHVNNHDSLRVSPQNTDTQTPCQVEVLPCKSEGIEPFNLVNSLPGQVKDVSSHTVNSPPCQVGDMSSRPINSPSGPLGVSCPMSCTVPASVSDHVTPVPSPSLPASVMSPPCFVSSGAASVLLNTTQAMSCEQPMALPVGLDCP